MPISQPPDANGKPVKLRAIYANAGVAAWYYEQLQRMVDAMALSIERQILGVYGQTEPPELAHDARSSRGNPSILLKRALAKWGGLWISKFDSLSLDLATAFARKSFTVTQTQMRAALAEAGFTVKFATTPASRAAYQAVVAEQVNLIKSIPSQYMREVESKVWSSVMQGGNMHALSRDLRKSYDVSVDRAATIARDQNNKAKAVIEKTRRQELGITQAIWIHSSAGKVPRRTHVAMHGKVFRISEGMYDSAEGKYVHPGELINCRCTSKAVIPAFASARETAHTVKSRTPAQMAGARNRAR